MKLFSATPNPPISFSLEQYNVLINSSQVISQESLTDYFYKLKDIFSTAFKGLTAQGTDTLVREVESNKFEILHKVKAIKFIDAKAYMTSKPENFKGKYVDYSLDLINSSNIILKDTESTLNNLKMAVASFINEYSEDKVFTLYGATYFTRSSKLMEEHRREIAKYFPLSNGSTKAYISDVLKTFNDLESIYKNIDVLGTTLNLTKINFIAKLTVDTSELIDSLIDQNTKTNVLARNSEVKKELINAIHTTAREVELLNYLYANAIMFYGTFKNLTDDLSKMPS